MSARKGNVVLLLLSIVFGSFGPRVFGRSLTGQERIRLFDSTKNRSNVPLTMDISFTKRVLTKPEVARKRREATMEETKELREKTKNDSITMRSVNIPLPDGSEIRLSETRTRIGTGGRLRSDTTVFANMEKTETWSEVTKINTGYGKNSPSYLIDHKLKQCWIRNDRRWSGYKVLRFGKIDPLIVLDIALSCDPNSPPHVEGLVSKNFLHSSVAAADGKVVDEIECINLENGKAKYRISLDPNDWQICRRIVWFDSKSGLASKIVEYKQFAKAKESGELFPRLVIRRYFDKEGKVEKVETINVSNVVIGLPISDDVFKFDVPTDYTIIDNRKK